MPNHITNRIQFFGKQEQINKVFELIKNESSCIDFNKLIPMPNELNLPSGGYQEEAVLYAISKKDTMERAKILFALKKTPCDYYGNYCNKIFNHWSAHEGRMYESAIEFERRLKDGTNKFDQTDYDGLGIKTFEDLGNAYINNIIKYGHISWYEWCIDNWGTKWNAYEDHCDQNSNTITFDTAWSCPLKVLEGLAALCYELNVSFSGVWADEDCGSNTGTFESNCVGSEFCFNYEYMEDCSQEAYEIYASLNGQSICFGKDENGMWVHYDCDTCPNSEKC